MTTLIQDLRYGIRMLLKQPTFTAVAVITLALGIGANTAIFSVVNAVLLRPLPFPQSDNLVTVTMANPRLGEDRIPLSVADFLDWRAQNQVFENLAAYTDNWFSLTGNPEPERIRGAWVTADFFSTLRVQPLLGRTFMTGEDAPGNPSLVILSFRLWQRRFDSNPQVIGQAITLNGKSRTVVGIMPEGFDFPPEGENSLPGEVQLWSLHTLTPTQQRGPYYLFGIGRLKSGTSIANANSELNSIGLRVRQANPLSNAETTFTSRSLKDSMVGNVRRMLFVLLGGVAFVLLIGSVNVANLSLSRAASRGSEMAIRSALGAGKGRIVRQLLTESLLLAAVGGVLGVLLAFWGVKLLLAIGSENLPRLHEVQIDTRVLGFTVLISLMSALIFGLIPAWRSARGSVSQSLKEARQVGGEEKGWHRTRNLLVVAEVALSLVLLAGAGLMLNSFLRLQRVSPGFVPQNILITHISLPDPRYKDDNQINAFYQQLIDRISKLPGVTATGIGMSLPPNQLSISDTFTIEGAPVIPGKSDPPSPVLFVSPGYFNALGVPLLRGRNFGDTDHANAPPVVIINEMLARRYFPNQDPIGRRMKIGGPERPRNTWMEIVGVVGDVPYSGLDISPEPAFYQHYLQNAWSSNYLVMRTTSDPRQLAGPVREAVWSLDKDLPVADVKTMQDLLSESVAKPRFRTFAFLVLGALALMLAVTGIYSVMSYMVTQRTREIGIRVALGAQRSNVIRLIVWHGMSLAIVGVVLGLVAAFALVRLMTSLLFGVGANDPLTFAAITVLLLAVSVVACWVPARRATKVDPLVALKYE
jgi:putative ABC transport system permease protein